MSEEEGEEEEKVDKEEDKEKEEENNKEVEKGEGRRGEVTTEAEVENGSQVIS